MEKTFTLFFLTGVKKVNLLYGVSISLNWIPAGFLRLYLFFFIKKKNKKQKNITKKTRK
jgi:hypothetical protein